MDIYAFIRKFATDNQVELEDKDVLRIAAALKAARFRGELTSEDMAKATPMVASRIGRVVGASPTKMKTAEASVSMKKDASNFEKIDAMVKQGKCARCGKPTAKVRLADYEEVNFCHECRTVLW